MTVIYVPSRSAGSDTTALPFGLVNVSDLSATLSRPQHTANFPSACVWMVPGTYSSEV